MIFPKPYRESTARQLQDTALAQQKGGLPSADALELSLQTRIIDEIILHRGFLNSFRFYYTSMTVDSKI